MLSKILLVAIFILLSWNSFQLSKSNQFLRSEIKQLAANDESVDDYLTVTKSLIENHSKTLEKQAKVSLKNNEVLNKLVTNDSSTKTLASLKASLDKMNSSLSKQLKSIESKTNSSISKQFTLTETNKKAIQEIKKTTYKVSDQIKKLSSDFAKNSGKLNSLNVCRNIETTVINRQTPTKKVITKLNTKAVDTKIVSGTIVKKEVISKPKPATKTVNAPTQDNPFYKMAITFQKTKDLHSKKELKKALEQLSKLKSEVWKSRKVENIPTKLVMSILSSIDITKSKWSSKDLTYNLDNVEKKIIELFFKLGVSK